MTRLKHRRAKHRSDNSPLERVKLATAKARLAKLETDLPQKPCPEYIRYEDLRPLHPEDRERLKAELIEKLTVDDEKRKKEKHDWYMSMAHWAP
jgi:hypothetical protein